MYVCTLRIAAKLIYMRVHYGFNTHEAPTRADTQSW